MWQISWQRICQLADRLVLLQATFMPKTANGEFGIAFVPKEIIA